ncbi:MAG TPA: hypothetical protein VK468_03250, partial [Pyrinomonadaceae bacterium]|nr:hypothetical protein [Pyrinomonadaceae bacterium]
MNFPDPKAFLPQAKSAGLAVLSAILLILAFPDFEVWVLAWFGLIPLLWAVEREKDSFAKSFVTGWIFGIVFFFGTCWWLTYAPIKYAGFPAFVAYFLLFCVTVVAGLFPALFTGLLSLLIKRFGNTAILAAPFVWVFTEFLRYWITGNNWNALGYSQAWNGLFDILPGIGGVLLVSFAVALINTGSVLPFLGKGRFNSRFVWMAELSVLIALLFVAFTSYEYWFPRTAQTLFMTERPQVIAIQPNVPMSGLTVEKWSELRRKHVELADAAINQLDKQLLFGKYGLQAVGKRLDSKDRPPITVIFPESPMNFMYDEDTEFQEFVSAFASMNDVNVLFNSAEPDPANKKYFNSAVLVDTRGKE